MRLALFFQQKKQIAVHAVAWVVFIVYEVSFVRIVSGYLPGSNSVGNSYVIPYFINIGLFYFHAFAIMQVSFGEKRKRPVLFIVMVLIELLCYLSLMALKDLPYKTNNPDFLSSLFQTRIGFYKQVWRGVYFLIFSTGFWLIHQSFKKEQMLKEAEKRALLQQQEKKNLELKLLSTQNAFLQSQINPHLLFNTLNFVHSELQQVSPKASDAIIVLSDMMRYSLAETKADGKIELEKEIEQIDNLIKLNQFRFADKLCIRLTTEGAFHQRRIYPLLLVPFVENLFKYAELFDPVNPVCIKIQLIENLLLFQTQNKKRKTVAFHSAGIGIKNVRTRLDSYYKDHFLLDVHDDPSTFSVKLRIEL